MEKIKNFAPESKDLIFASNLFTRSYLDYFVMMGYDGAIERKATSFLQAAKVALKKNGRIILVHVKMDSKIMKELGEKLGLRATLVPLFDLRTVNSSAKFIRRINTPEKRISRRISRYGASSEIKPEDLQQTAVIFRK